jgi:hypothetical protein
MPRQSPQNSIKVMSIFSSNTPTKSSSVFLFMLLILLGWGISCKDLNSNAIAPKQDTDSNQKMLSILAEVRRKMNNPKNVFSAEPKLKYIDSLGNAAKTSDEQVTLGFQKATYLLEYGDEAQSVSWYEKIFEIVKGIPASRKTVLPALGMAYMRQAERTNCLHNHNADACIMPIRGGGIHQDKSAARKAIETFETVLKEDPSNLDAIWLLNIAYMTVGEYPDKVPAAWRIPNLDKPGPVQVKPFTDIAPDLNLAVNNRAGSVIVDDFNHDGYLDIVSSAWGLDDPMHFYLNNADGTFKDASVSSGLSAFTGGLNMVQTDYNNDGNLDIFVLRGAWQGQSGFGEQPNSLLRNNGDGTFTDVTIDAGLLSFHPTQTATWNDFNHDGWLDIFIGNESTGGLNIHPCEFYINNQNGTFTNIANPDDFNVIAFVKGVTSGDYDNDGWPDIFISSLSGQKLLLHNKGIPGKVPIFEEISQKAGFVNDLSRTFPTGFFDYDNDGFLDLFVCNYEFDRPLSYYSAREALHPSNDRAGKLSIYRNNQNGTFSNVSTQLHMNQTVFAMGANFGDIDNDGWLDLYMATGNPNYQSLVPNKMYKNLGGKDFADVTVSARVGNLQKGHGVSFVDLNNNGVQDIFVDMGGAYRGDAFPASFYLNPGQNSNNWICLNLEGTKSNRAAIGAKVTVSFHENGVARKLYREVNSGASFGCSPLRREIGIGKAAKIDEIKIEWPASGITQVLKDVSPNQFIKVKEGQDGFEPVALKTLEFKKIDGTMPMCTTPSK